MNTSHKQKTRRPGEADPDFGKHGSVSMYELDFPEKLQGTRLIHGLAHSDGKVIIGADLYDAKIQLNVYALIRLNDDGRLDKKFAELGFHVGSFLDGHSCGAGKVTVLDDGKILLLGWTLSPDNGWGELVVARFHENGGIDESFGEKGRRIIPNAENSKFVVTSESIQVNSQGTLFITANYANPDASDHYSASIYSIKADGSWNNEFNGTGHLKFTVDAASPFTAVNSCLLQGDKLLIAGNALLQGLETAYVARLNPDGSPDRGFGDIRTPGLFTLRVNNLSNRFNDLSQGPDGSLACFGQSGADWETSAEGLLSMLTPNGTPHRLFNNGEPLLTQLDSSPTGIRWRCGYTQEDGKLVALSGDQNPYLARLLPDGKPDEGFGESGYVELKDSDVDKKPLFQLIKGSDNRILLSLNYAHLGGFGRIDAYLG